MRDERLLARGLWTAEARDGVARAARDAAASAKTWAGRGDKEAADRAAVDAMRAALADAPLNGVVVIGEGEKDAAPMLANGEHVGRAAPGDPEVDVAVDPLDGTSLVARGEPGAICVIALAPRGTMFDPGPAFYLEKLVTAGDIRGLDLDAPVAETLGRIARANDRAVADLTVAILDKPRHGVLHNRIREAGARVRLLAEGDVSAAAIAADPDDPEIDVLLGIGGSPEGVITACAVRALGGTMLARLATQQGPLTHERVLTLDDLVASEQVLYAAARV